MVEKKVLIWFGGFSFLCGLLGGIVCIWLVEPMVAGAQTFHPNVVLAGEVRVVDEDGNVRIALNQDGIALFDESFKRRLQIRANPTAGVHILDPDEHPRAELFLASSGKTHLYLHDSNHTLATVVDESELTFLGPNGNELILALDRSRKGTLRVLSRAGTGPSLIFQDRGQKRQLVIGPREQQGEEGKPDLGRAVSTILLYDKEGELVGSLPEEADVRVPN